MDNSIANLKVFLACIIGTILEWYDFALFGVLSPLLSEIFFPNKDKTTGLIIMLALFATGFIMRPLGGIFFGHIGDKYGRKKAIVMSIFLMTFSTLAIGLLPVSHTPATSLVFILMILRLIQGFAVSGELPGMVTFFSELCDKKRFFFYQSFIYSGLMIGMLMGTLIGKAALSYHAQFSFSWRIPFLLSFLLGIAGLYLRIRISESPYYLKMVEQQKISNLPFKLILVQYKAKFLLGTVIVLSGSILTYFITLAYPIYINSLFHHYTYLYIQATMIMIVITVTPLFTWFTNKENFIPLFMIGLLLFVILPVPILLLVNTHNIYHMLLVGVIFSICFSSFQALVGATVCLIYPNHIRYTGIALSSNVAILFSGAFPLISASLTKVTGYFMPSVILISVLSLLSASLLFFIRKKINFIHLN